MKEGVYKDHIGLQCFPAFLWCVCILSGDCHVFVLYPSYLQAMSFCCILHVFIITHDFVNLKHNLLWECGSVIGQGLLDGSTHRHIGNVCFVFVADRCFFVVFSVIVVAAVFIVFVSFFFFSSTATTLSTIKL